MYEPPAFHPRRPGLVAPVRIDPTGKAGPTRGQARGPRWRTTSRGLVVPARVECTTEQRIVEVAAVLKRQEAVTGWAGLRWLGGAWFDGTTAASQPRDVTVVAGRHRLAQPGFTVSQEFLAPPETQVVDGVPVTLAVRSVVHEMRHAATLGEAVVALDMACYNDLVSLAEVASYVEKLGPVTGIQQARDALAEGEENSWSPRETKMRGVWTRRAGLPRPLCNRPVFTLDGRMVGTPDVISDQVGLLGQYHGKDHLGLTGVSNDIKKDEAFRDLGLETVAMLAPDWSDLDAFAERLRAAARRAQARTGPRLWTLDPPRWWTPTHTVALRRALTAAERARVLRYRRVA